MAEYIFGVSEGHCSAAVRAIVEGYGCEVVDHTGPACLCGWGCGAAPCPKARRHWFTTRNLGDFENSAKERTVMAAVRRAEGK